MSSKSPSTHMPMWMKIQSKKTQAFFSFIMIRKTIKNFLFSLYDEKDNRKSLSPPLLQEKVITNFLPIIKVYPK